MIHQMESDLKNLQALEVTRGDHFGNQVNGRLRRACCRIYIVVVRRRRNRRRNRSKRRHNRSCPSVRDVGLT